jgi:hypothetical protein
MYLRQIYIRVPIDRVLAAGEQIRSLKNEI